MSQDMLQSLARSNDYDQRASGYARHRVTHPGVVEALIADGGLCEETRVLDVGCGTGNYAAVLSARSGCCMFGVEPSARMLERARGAAPWGSLVQGSAEKLPFADSSFDLVMSTDVIHHLSDRTAFFADAARVLRPGGRIVTVTDSHDDIPKRVPLSSHFPETVAVELNRYPSTRSLLDEMARAGFSDTRLTQVRHEYPLDDIQAYRDRAFSSLLLIDEAAFRRGIDRLETELARGPIPCLSLYTMIWGTRMKR